MMIFINKCVKVFVYRYYDYQFFAKTIQMISLMTGKSENPLVHHILCSAYYMILMLYNLIYCFPFSTYTWFEAPHIIIDLGWQAIWKQMHIICNALVEYRYTEKNRRLFRIA